MSQRAGLGLSVLVIMTTLYTLLNNNWTVTDTRADSYNSYAAFQCLRLRLKFQTMTSAKTIRTESLTRAVKELMTCPYNPNITQREIYRIKLRLYCNATENFLLSQQNTEVGQKIHYETNRKLTKTVDKELHHMLPQRLPWSGAGLGRCAVVGSGGILKNSKCGAQIDSHHYIIRFNLAPINDSEDVGNRSSLLTINPSQIRNGYPNLKKNGSSLANRVSAYGNSSLLMSPFSHAFTTLLSLAVHRALRPLRPNQSVLFFNPDYLLDIAQRWKVWGLKERRLSSGIMLVTVAMELCEEVHLYGYWPFSTDLSENPIPHHYYDNVLPHPGNHVMSQEFLFLLQLHSQGALQLHLGTCST